MEKLKTKKEIIKFLKKNDKFFIENYFDNKYEFIDLNDKILLGKTIIKDNFTTDYFENLKQKGHQYIINVHNHISISDKELKEVPFQFHYCHGDFDCSNNQISYIDFAPKIINGHFDCSLNHVRSLKDGPIQVKKDYFVSLNQLKDLEGCPYMIEGVFDCSKNQLENLVFLPEIVASNRIMMLDNKGLLKYKNENIKMSNGEFLWNNNFSFWKKLYLQEKALKQHEDIMNDLNISLSKVKCIKSSHKI